jgi:hypothetical protein
VSSLRAYRWTSGFYQLFLGLWFGAIVMLVFAAAITFATVRGELPQWTETQQNILAGGIVGNVIRNGLTMIQLTCAVVVAVCMLLQAVVFGDRLRHGWLNRLRVALIAIPIVIVITDVAYISPTMHTLRQGMHDQANANRDADKAAFDRYHKLSERITGGAMFMLAGALLVSPFVLTTGKRDEPTSG